MVSIPLKPKPIQIQDSRQASGNLQSRKMKKQKSVETIRGYSDKKNDVKQLITLSQKHVNKLQEQLKGTKKELLVLSDEVVHEHHEFFLDKRNVHKHHCGDHDDFPLPSPT